MVIFVAAVVTHMLHPHTELRLVNEAIGFGVFATRLIPKGTITWVRDDLDRAFPPGDLQSFGAELRTMLDKYTFVDANGLAVLCWDLARYINHACDANCLGAGYDFEIAVRDIHPGEELTDDYGTLNLREPFRCLCGQANCRQYVQPDDLTRLHERWDVELRQAFPHIVRVAQPLQDFVRNFPEVMAAAADPAKMRSCRFNYSPRICADRLELAS
jgi:hypothetical protein